jgi:diguanylate cyclase (GGDEF)-like protein
MPSLTWRRLREQHFYDYPHVALVYWCAHGVVGLVVILAALTWFVSQPTSTMTHVAAMGMVCALAACFPLHPSKDSRIYLGGEVFVFLTFLLFGIHAAILASACETAAGACKVSKRLSTRVSSVATSVSVLGVVLVVSTLIVPAPADAHGAVLLAMAALVAIAHVHLCAIAAYAYPVIKGKVTLDLGSVFRRHAWPSISVAAGTVVSTLLYLALARHGIVVFVTTSAVVVSLMAAAHFWQSYRRGADEHSLRMSEAAKQLREAAYFDSLTGLPNRRTFIEKIEQVLEQTSPRYAVMFIDCDGFKTVNDVHGHRGGDTFLLEVGRRLRTELRDDDVVARLGGDEFAVILHDLDVARALEVAERMVVHMRLPVPMARGAATSTLSIGIATSDVAYTSASDLLKDADLAMYAAKEAGKNRVIVFDAALREEHRAKVDLEVDAMDALDKQAFTLAFQPLFRIRDRRLIGFEALARWNHPTRGAVSPAVFVPLLTQLGAITRLTHQLVPRAARQLAVMQAINPRLKMHVNVCADDLSDPAFADAVLAAVKQSNIPPASLVIELTESNLIDALEDTMTTIGKLRDHGLGVAIDDFGTGYSSLSRLTEIPVTSYKIDAAFVQSLTPDSKQLEVVKVIVALGRTLGKGVIAEGIESEEQMALLLASGCSHGQGYLYARPMQAADALEHVRRDMAALLALPARDDDDPASGFDSSTFDHLIH